jgi:hypothetical protein
VLTDRVDQLGQSKLAVSERLSDGVFNDPSFKVNRLPGRWRQFDAAVILDRPAYLSEILPTPP